MKRNYCYKLFFLILVFFLCITSVSAAECTTEELRELKQLAKKVDFGYTFNEKNRVFEIFIYNFSNKFYINSSTIGFVNYENPIQNLGKFSGGFNAKITVYASTKTNCYESKLANLTLEIPYYNYYSTHDECEEYEKFNLCKKWFNTSDVTEKDFEEALEKYKLELQENNGENFLTVILNFITTNYICFLVAAIIIAVIVLFNLYLKKKKTNKIDFGD